MLPGTRKGTAGIPTSRTIVCEPPGISTLTGSLRKLGVPKPWSQCRPTLGWVGQRSKPAGPGASALGNPAIVTVAGPLARGPRTTRRTGESGLAIGVDSAASRSMAMQQRSVSDSKTMRTASTASGSCSGNCALSPCPSSALGAFACLLPVRPQPESTRSGGAAGRPAAAPARDTHLQRATGQNRREALIRFRSAALSIELIRRLSRERTSSRGREPFGLHNRLGARPPVWIGPSVSPLKKPGRPSTSSGRAEKVVVNQGGGPLMLSLSKHGVGFFNGLVSPIVRRC